MSSGNWQQEKKRNYQLRKKLVTASDTIKTGTATYTGIIENPVYVADPAADLTITVPDGAYIGQEVYITDKSNSGSKTITISVSKHYTSTPETFTISSEAQDLHLTWNGEKWSTTGGTATAT